MLRNAKDKACPSRTRRAGASLVLLAVAVFAAAVALALYAERRPGG